jgi:preprotein translocase subunit SecG
MLTFLLVVQAIVAVMLVGVILMQQSEGGGLGMGGSPTGLMSARGAADFLTRATTILAAIFIGLSILHAVLATRTGTGVSTIDTSLARPQAPVAPPPTTQPTVPLAGQPATPVLSPVAAPPLANTAPTVPIATARPKVEPRPAPTPRPTPRTEAQRTVVTPTPVALTVTPSIPKAAAPAPTPAQGPPANPN